MLATLSTERVFLLFLLVSIVSWCVEWSAMGAHVSSQGVSLRIGRERPSRWRALSHLATVSLWLTAPIAGLSLVLNLIRFARGG